ncbi:hypothetical protein B0H11DRAFT_2189633 [Mycena galericulata]|nr:hypothetical protein B0H11DRAFT_2189633 [Mycena galericulata]
MPPYIHYEGMQDLSEASVLDNSIDIENRQITLAVHSLTQDTYNPATPLITYEMFKPFPSKTVKTIPLSSNCQGRQDCRARACVIMPRRCTAFSGTSLLPPILSSTLTDTILIRPAPEDRCKTASVGCRIPAILMRISVLLSTYSRAIGSYWGATELVTQIYWELPGFRGLLLGSPTGGTCLPSYPDYWHYRVLPGHVIQEIIKQASTYTGRAHPSTMNQPLQQIPGLGQRRQTPDAVDIVPGLSLLSRRGEAPIDLMDQHSAQQIPGLGQDSQNVGVPAMADVIPGLSNFSRGGSNQPLQQPSLGVNSDMDMAGIIPGGETWGNPLLSLHLCLVSLRATSGQWQLLHRSATNFLEQGNQE